MHINSQEIEQFALTFKFNFIDAQPKQTLQIDGFKPIYFSNEPNSESDNLPGDGCGKNMIDAYPTAHNPYEPGITAFFIWLSHQIHELRMIDIGALWGHTSLVAASMFKESNIQLFEMNPLTSAILQANTKLNHNLNSTFTSHNVLLSNINSETMVTFKHYTARYGNGEGGQNLSKLKILRENLKTRIKKLLHTKSHGMYITQRMKVATLDSIFLDDTFIPNLIKIDVEGSQYNIVDGAKNIIQKHRPILLIEFDEPGAANYIGRTNRELVSLLACWGYCCLWGDHRKRETNFVIIKEDTKLDIEVNSLGIFYPC